MKKVRTILIVAVFLAAFAMVITGRATARPEIAETHTPSPQTQDKKLSEADEVGVISLDAQEFINIPSTANPGSFMQLGPALSYETEPNNSAATASPIAGSSAAIWGNVYPNGDLDYFSFTAVAGDRVYAAVMTSFSANASSDSQLRVFASDGTTEIEFDDDDGVLGGLSSTIAGATIPSSGTYYLRVNHFSATNQLRPYNLYFRLQSGAPTPEVEVNDTPGTANPLPAGGWVSGTRDPAVATEQDWYSFTASAGDTVYLGMDLDPERDNVQWNGRLGIALFGDASNQILVVDDASTGSVTNPLSEAHYMTIKTAGTYYAFVDSASAATGGPTATYNLSVTIFPASNEGVNCTTYTSTDVPQTIGPGAGLVSSTITVPGNPRIADIDVEIQLNHTIMGDIDAHLRSPQGNDNGLFTDIGAAAAGGQTQMDIIFDDEAAIPPLFTVLRGPVVKPELAYRLAWFDQENAGGTWTLDLRDDVTNANGGTLTGWSIRICEPPPLTACPGGTVATTLYSSNFETGDGGFTHSGTADEWELGLPTFVPITSCNSGVNCWKTDLDNTYNASSIQDLLSPSIPVTGTGVIGPVYLSWAQRYHLENATFDHAYVEVRQAGGANPTRLWEWLDATMNDTIGSPAVTIAESGGWGVYTKDISSYFGQNIEVLFHLDSDTTVQLAGLAIDDVSVTACAPPPAISISLDKTVGTDPNTCAATDSVALPFFGGSVTYCYEVTNTGNVSFNSHDLVDDQLGTILNDFPFVLAPGDSTYITQTAVVTATVTNTGVWTATNGTDTATDTDTALVTVPVPAPVVVLDKTVGTDPNTCASTGSITLPFGGGDVTYCYTIENTGNITLTNHNLVDSELGQLLSDFPYTLAPGGSAFMTATTTITQTTVNTATWTADLPAAPITVTASSTDSALVTVSGADPEIAVAPTSLATTQPWNVQTTAVMSISNVGTGVLTWTVQESPASASQGNVLYDNGPLVNSPGTGSGGADESMLQTNLTMNILGFGHQTTANNSVADDFVIPTGEQWTIDTITFYAYQTGSTTTSTITGMNVDIYDGDPSSGGTVIASSTTMLSSQWSNIYRVTNTTSGNTQRPIMATVMDLGSLVLTEGTYWIEWQASGSLASGPWAPPITINGQTATGNGLQNLAGVWGAALDVGQQGFPFVINGSNISADCGNDIPWVSANPTSGSNSANTSTDVTVTFDSTGLAVGVYTGDLCVNSNDGDTPLVVVPLTLTVEASYGVDISPDDAASGAPGSTVIYTLSVTNTGNVTDTFDLTASGNTWTTTPSVSSVTLGAGESDTFTVSIDIPGNAGNGDDDTATITATSQGDNSVDDSANLTTTAVVGAVYGVDLSGDEATSGLVGTAVTYTVEITNTGNVADVFDLVVSGETWTTTLSVNSVSLNAGASDSFQVTVDIPANAGDGDNDTATITATSQGDGSATDSADLTTTAVLSAVYGVTLSGNDALTGTVGTVVTYTVWVTNTGNVVDTFDIAVAGNTWTTTLSANSLTLNAGESGMVSVTVAIPAGANNGDTDAVTVTATSQGDSNESDSAVLTTTASSTGPVSYTVFLPVVFKP